MSNLILYDPRFVAPGFGAVYGGSDLSADKAIGLTLYAKKPIKLYRIAAYGTPYETIAAGGLVGVIRSWVVRSGNVWWAFKDGAGADYYAQHGADNFELTDEIQTAIDRQESAEQQILTDEEIAAKGKFVYYFEKYGKVVLLSTVGLVVFAQVMKHFNKSK